jgi:Uma2 family endonuclease
MATDPLRRLSPEEYLAFERGSETKHQYVDGVIFAMAGASERHNAIAGSLITEIGLQLRGRPCRVYPGDLRVAISPAGPFYYPDVVALGTEPQLLDDERDTLVNPAVVIEVLSPSTEAFDRGLKFAHYRCVASLHEVLFVAQDAVRIERFARRPEGQWVLSDHVGTEAAVELPTLGCRLELARVYEKVSFE